MESLFTPFMKTFEGYSIGKTLSLLKDPDIISFAGGLPSPDVFPNEFIRAAADRSLREGCREALQYSAVPGEKSLIEAIIDFLGRDGIRLSPENVVITTSGQHGLDLVGRLFLSPGDVIVTDLPTFGGALAAFEMEDPAYASVDIEEDGSNVEGLAAAIEESIERGRKPKFIYVVPDFQNPSGITMSLEKRRAVLALAVKYGLPLVEDSPYRDLRYRGERVPSIFSLDENRGNVIGLYTFSKILCPGLRVGFNIGPAAVVEKFHFIKSANLLNTPKFNQDLCTAFLREYDVEAHFRKSREYYTEKLRFFLGAMEENFPPEMGVTWTKPEGGLFLWVTVPEKIDTAELLRLAIQEKVAFIPGEAFYPKGRVQRNHMRVNFSFPTREQIVEGVKRLSQAVRKMSA
ncbi:MAG: PLP-dependent aminotransferase family protein [Candidatus Aminicenantes bacterium]|nr:PLP-dependent aminotransferase family protein [Candidatus Aminicenantes bacterium]